MLARYKQVGGAREGLARLPGCLDPCTRHSPHQARALQPHTQHPPSRQPTDPTTARPPAGGGPAAPPAPPKRGALHRRLLRVPRIAGPLCAAAHLRRRRLPQPGRQAGNRGCRAGCRPRPLQPAVHPSAPAAPARQERQLQRALLRQRPQPCTANPRGPLRTAHCSLPTAHCPLLTAHCSLPAARCPLLAAHCSLRTAHCSLLAARCSLLTAHCSLLTARCSLLAAHCPGPHRLWSCASWARCTQ